ncbi:MAG: T9SS type A sorting domain-containing protein [Candidatus Krumholzibacteria bacterium]|nr:T9SS type A sorting domain-containing protein [Candidatus Krumholzibacteria bacterium]
MLANALLKSLAIGVFVAAWPCGPDTLARSDAQDVNQLRLLKQREVPDDPPGKPARPQAGAPRSAPVQFGPFASIQANVSDSGANIVGDAANEPSIAVDPGDPNRMAIGWRQFDTIASNFRQAGWAFSLDGGRSWTFRGVLDEGVFRSDPVLSFDGGVFYYNSLRVVNNVFTCDVFKSANAGVWWGPPVFSYGGDKLWMTVDRTAGIGGGNIYCAWSIAANQYGNDTFTRSTDAAQTFSTPSGIPSTPIWGTLDVASDGTLYVAGIDPNNASNFLLSRSTNAKDPLAAPTFDWTIPVNMNGSVAFSISASPNPGGLLGQVWLAVDGSSGPTAGNIYMLCSVDPVGSDPMDVHFTRSTSGGSTWNTPVRINDDPSTSAWQWFGTMSVAPNGRIDVVWNDTRNGATFRDSELYYAYSADGGTTWSPNQRLSPQWDSFLGWPNQNKIGDYYHMISDDVGAHLAWAATFNGEQDVYYLRIGDYDCNANSVADSLDILLGTSPDDDMNGRPDECEGPAAGIRESGAPSYRLYQNAPNPFNPTTTIRYEVPSNGGHVRLQIFDLAGHLVRTLADRRETAGTKSVLWDGKNSWGSPVASGLYFYRLEATGFVETRKLVLLK